MTTKTPPARYVLAAAAFMGAAAIIAPAAASATPAPAVSHAAPASAHVGAPVANSLDTKLTVINDTYFGMTVWMGAGAAADTVPTQMTTVLPGGSTQMQGWNPLPHGNDVSATIDYSLSTLGSSDRVSVQGKNPAVGWPSLHLQGFEQDNLSAGETVTHTIGTHTLELHRNTDLPDAKDLVVTVKS